MSQQSFGEKNSKIYLAVRSHMPREGISQPASERCQVINEVKVGFNGAEQRGEKMRETRAGTKTCHS